MGNRGARNQNYGYGDPYLNQYGGQQGLGGYDPYGGYGRGGYTITTAPNVIQEPWAVTQWTEYYVPTVGARQKRPVIYVAAQLPAPNPCAGFGGGFGGGLGGLGGYGGHLGGLGGLGGYGGHHGGLGGLGGYGGHHGGLGGLGGGLGGLGGGLGGRGLGGGLGGRGLGGLGSGLGGRGLGGGLGGRGGALQRFI